ncbi:MAG: cardiolipin synthase [Phycisphaerae bacterium]|jgi:cardiolipin synthase
MPPFWVVVLGIDVLLIPFVIASVLRQRKEPMAMLAWILGVLALPYVGMALYWLMGSNRVVRRTRRRRRRIAHLIAQLENWTRSYVAAGGQDHTPELPEDLRAIAHVGQRLAQMPPTRGNEVEVYEEANATYSALEEAIRQARHHVHLEYYIWRPDETGLAFRDLLVQKARSGVECRLLLDSVGCWRLGRRFTKPLTDAGAQVAFYLPLHPLRKRWSPHLRNHRKIVVIDGQHAFLGSQNIGDEYRGRLRQLSPWYDTHVRVSGPAALFLQRTFAEDWLFATRENLVGEAYFAAPSHPGRTVVQILPTGPDQNISPLEQVVFAAVSSARESIRIATPYFVPGPGLRMALAHARARDVAVELVLPTRSDSPIVLCAGRSFYGELLEVGVHIHEYDGGMLHSKLVTVDDRWCMLGSANMDVRSFRLNFEVTALVYDAAVTRTLSAYIERFVKGARSVSMRDVRQRTLTQQLAEGAARLLTPLL